jgi:hypothetical protein
MLLVNNEPPRQSRADTLGKLLLEIFTGLPTADLEEKCRRLAVASLVFAHQEHRLCEVEQRQRARREYLLTKATGLALRKLDDLGRDFTLFLCTAVRGSS